MTARGRGQQSSCRQACLASLRRVAAGGTALDPEVVRHDRNHRRVLAVLSYVRGQD
jgi:hypothetical protein